MDSKSKQGAQQMKADKSTLKATAKRLAELERLTQALYEDKVLGTVPEAVFKNLMTKYEAERVEKQSLVQELKKRLADTAQVGNVFDKAFLGVVMGFLRVPHGKAAIHAFQQTAEQADFIILGWAGLVVSCGNLLTGVPSIHVDDWLMGILYLDPVLFRLVNLLFVLIG